MKSPGQHFRALPGLYAVCRLDAAAPVPEWANGPFVNITRTEDELSLVCPAERVPLDVRAERDWRVLKVAGPFSFTTVGVLASLAEPLARAGISVLALATYDTDYLLVKNPTFTLAVSSLEAAGHVRSA